MSHDDVSARREESLNRQKVLASVPHVACRGRLRGDDPLLLHTSRHKQTTTGLHSQTFTTLSSLIPPQEGATVWELQIPLLLAFWGHLYSVIV